MPGKIFWGGGAQAILQGGLLVRLFLHKTIARFKHWLQWELPLTRAVMQAMVCVFVGDPGIEKKNQTWDYCILPVHI